jgi:hypothetical protein
MYVLGHDYVSEHYETVTEADAVEDFQEEITVGLVLEERLAVVTTERQEVEVVAAIETVGMLGHERTIGNGTKICL